MKFSKKALVFAVAVLVFVCCIFGENQTQAGTQNRYEADAVTYVRFSGMAEALPVSYVKEGRQLLTGDGEKNVYSILGSTLLEDASSADKLAHIINAGKNMYGKGKHPDYSCTVMTDGGWELFPDQVEYKTYSIWKQPAGSRWKDYFKKYLKDRSVDSPVVMKESYTFDWDGVETEVVTASNVVVSDEMELKTSDGKDKKSPLPLNKHAAVQMGKNKKWKKCRCVFNMNGELTMREYRYFPKYLVCDLDGDGHSELVAYSDGSGSLRQRIVVYKLVDGVPERSFSITP